jgi:hypothetical protein
VPLIQKLAVKKLSKIVRLTLREMILTFELQFAETQDIFESRLKPNKSNCDITHEEWYNMEIKGNEAIEKSVTVF